MGLDPRMLLSFQDPFSCLPALTRVVAISHIGFLVCLFEIFVASQQLRIRQLMMSQDSESQDQDDTFFDWKFRVQTTRRNKLFFCISCRTIFSIVCYRSPRNSTEFRGVLPHESMIGLVESGCILCAQLCSPLHDIRVERIEHYWSRRRNAEKDVLEFQLSDDLARDVSGFMPGFALMQSSDVREKYNTKDLHGNMLEGLPETTDNEATWGVIQRWLSECLSTHVDCNYNLHSLEKPTRLIDVEILMDSEPEKDRVLLVKSTAALPAEKYATLSHCWGGEVPSQLKSSETCERLNSGWAVKELPKTFREAVITIRKLGIRYLWIDSLCIQQDCDEDWKRESQTMDLVYTRSYLNIAAAGAKNSSIGLFLERKPKHIQPFEADMRQHGGTGGEDIFTPYLFFRQDLWRTYVNESPLGRRGWVTQERELSPRQLNFTEAGVLWECRCLRDTEFPFDWPQWSERGSDTRSYKSLIRRIEAFEKKGTSMSESERSTELVHIYNEWDNTIQGYAPSKFTKETDRPIAIAGLAKKMQSAVKDTYIAGLWKSRLLSQLLWEVAWMPRPTSSHLGRPGQIPVPTWTWLSNASPIAMFGSPHHSCVWFGDSNPVAEVASDEPSHLEMDLTGELSGGYIRLHALHWPASIDMKEAFAEGLPHVPVQIPGAPGNGTATGWPDEMTDPQTGTQQFIAVPMMVYSKYCAATGLLLKQKNEEQEKYERFGVFTLFCGEGSESFKSWADELQRATTEKKFHEFKEFVIY